MSESGNFRQGVGGGGESGGEGEGEPSSMILFLSPHLILQSGFNGDFQRKLQFSKIQLLIPLETYGIYDFL